MYPCTDNTPRISECTQHQRTENIIWFTLSHVVYRFNMFRYKHFFSESVVVVEYQSRGEVSRLVMELELTVNSSRIILSPYCAATPSRTVYLFNLVSIQFLVSHYLT